MKKTVLHLRSSGGLLGAENVILELCKRADQNGYNAVIGAINNLKDPYPEFLKVAELNGIKTVLFPCKNQFDLNCAKKIRNFVLSNKIDILHSHGYKEDFFTVVSRLKIPTIATNHLWKKNNLKARFYCFLDSIFLKSFNKVVGVSDEIVRELKRLKLKSAEKIANGIDLNRLVIDGKAKKQFEEFKINESEIVIGMISSITQEKGHEFAVRAFSGVLQTERKIKLLIVGDGNRIDSIRKLVSDLNISDKVVFAGKRFDIPEILSIIDVYLLPSLIEGLPMSLLEAMAAKKAVIASAVGEIPNVIVNDVNGLIVQPRVIRVLELALMDLLINSEKRKQMGECAFATVTRNYSSDSMAKKYFEIYDELLLK